MMTTIEKAEQLLDEMNQSEKIQLLQMIARDLSSDVPGIVKTTGVTWAKPQSSRHHSLHSRSGLLWPGCTDPR